MSKFISISEIVILEDRQRQEFQADRMEELRQSIETNGLINPITLRDYNDNKVLVAGESRLKAIIDLHTLGIPFKFDGKVVPAGKIPYTDVGELSILEAEEMELDENLKRTDLTWQEHAKAVNRLMELRKKQRAEQIATSAQDPTKPPPAVSAPSVASVTRELYPDQTKGKSDGDLGSLQAAVRKEILVAQHLDNPAVAGAKSADEAFKILKRQEEANKNRALAEAVGASFNASLHQAFNVNCIHWMSQPENAERFDVILTDPPYGMGADTFGDGGGKFTGIEHHYDDSPQAWHELMKAWAPLSFKVAKRQAHAYVFCDIDKFHSLKALMQEAGWDVFRTPIMVYKTGGGRVPRPEHGPRRQYELVLYAIKGGKPVNCILPDVIPSTADDNLSHGAQKPVMVFQNLLQRSARPGDDVLDSFSGSGTIFPAANTMKVRATGLELTPEYFGMGLKRLQDLTVVETLEEKK